MVTDIETRVFSRVKNKYPQRLKTKYPDTLFTTSYRVVTPAKFPTVYLHELPSAELADDLEGTSINAVRSTIQVDVSDNVSMDNATEVMNYVVGVMKSMRYRVTQFPNFQTDPNVFIKQARFQRVIADSDVL